MKTLVALMLVLGIASVASADLSLDFTYLGGGDYLVQVVQDAPNTAGSGGVLTIPVGGWSVSDLFVIPKLEFTGTSFYGWDWGLAGIGINENQEVQITAVPNLGAGTPGIGSELDIIFGPSPYEHTASFVLSTVLDAPPEGYQWEYKGKHFGLYGQWDGAILDPTIILGGNPTPVLVPIPEPAAMALLGVGTLLMRRRKQT